MTLKPFDCGPAIDKDPAKEYSRILTAAVISSQFRQMLLSNPGKAISAGFAGEAFYLENEEKNRLAAIRATTLADFATELTLMQTQRAIMFNSIAGD